MTNFSLFICALTLVFSSCAAVPKQDREVASVEQKMCVPCADGGQYPVHLTFDDGPYAKLTNEILEVLREKNVEATFFELTSAYSSKQKEKALSNYDDATPEQLAIILDGIHRGGHGLACHTLEHIDHIAADVTVEKAKANIRRGIALQPKESLNYLRLPYGRGWYNEKKADDQKRADEIIAFIKSLGYKHLGWDIDSFDWSKSFHSHQPKALLADICSQHGGIVLMHDIQTYEARHLANEIDSIRCSGHKLVGLKEMEARNATQPMTSFQDHADYQVVDCPGGTKHIRDGSCLIKPK